MNKHARPTIITLDGPAGVGKSSLARLLAQSLALPFMDTGAMFRCLALHVGEKGLEMSGTELEKRLQTLDFALSGSGEHSILLCNGKDPGQNIRTEAIGTLASRLAALPEVRAFTRVKQQSMGANCSLVAEGRDMGTAIFPQARPKFFLEADPHIRALRRRKQLAEQGRTEKLEELEAQIRRRDELDRTRVLAPLKPAPDAIIIDTSPLTRQEVLEEMLKHAHDALG